MKSLKVKPEFKVSYWGRKTQSGYSVYIKSKQNSPKHIVHDTGVRLERGQWDKRNSRPKIKPAKLMELEAQLKATYTYLYQEGQQPTLTDILAHRNDPKRPAGQKIIDWCDDYLSKPYSHGQKKAVGTVRSNLMEFGSSITFDRFRKPQIRSFFEWLSSRGVANNSQYKRLRALINVAEHAGIDATELKAYRLGYSTVNAMTPRLTWVEVKRIMKVEPKSTIEEVAKDVFLLICFSGLRIEDVLNPLQPKIHAAYYSATQRKTKREVYVTLHKYNEPLFRKYIGKVGYSRQRLSDALDRILERAGLTDEITILRNVGHQVKESKMPKYKAIAFHSGRRFYSRLLNDLGLGAEIARDELGHTFKSITELYAGSQEHALRIARVRNAMEKLDKKMNELSALMKVA